MIGVPVNSSLWVVGIPCMALDTLVEGFLITWPSYCNRCMRGEGGRGDQILVNRQAAWNTGGGGSLTSLHTYIENNIIPLSGLGNILGHIGDYGIRSDDDTTTTYHEHLPMRDTPIRYQGGR